MAGYYDLSGWSPARRQRINTLFPGSLSGPRQPGETSVLGGALGGFGQGAAQIGINDTPAQALAKVVSGAVSGKQAAQSAQRQERIQDIHLDGYRRQQDQAAAGEAAFGDAIKQLDPQKARVATLLRALSPEKAAEYIAGPKAEYKELNGALYQVGGGSDPQKLVEAGLNRYQQQTLANDGRRIGIEENRFGEERTNNAFNRDAKLRELGQGDTRIANQRDQDLYGRDKPETVSAGGAVYRIGPDGKAAQVVAAAPELKGDGGSGFFSYDPGKQSLTPLTEGRPSAYQEQDLDLRRRADQRAAAEAADKAKREGAAQGFIDTLPDDDPQKARLKAVLANPALGPALLQKYENVGGQGLVAVDPLGRSNPTVAVPEKTSANTQASLDAQRQAEQRKADYQATRDQITDAQKKADFDLDVAKAERGDTQAAQRIEIERQRLAIEAQKAAREKQGTTGAASQPANQLREQYGQATKTIRDIPANYSRIQSGFQQGSGPGDVAGIYAYMKLLDPTSVVREGEFATAENAGGVSEYIRNLFNKAQSGQRLTPEVRGQILEAAQGQLKGYKQQYESTVRNYSDFAKRAGLAPEDVIAPIEFPDFGAPAAGADAAAAEDAPAEAAAPAPPSLGGPKPPKGEHDEDYNKMFGFP